MRPRDELRPHECTLRTEDTRIELIQLLTSEIAVRIAGAYTEVRIRDAAFPHRVQDLLRVDLSGFVHTRKHPARTLNYRRAQHA